MPCFQQSKMELIITIFRVFPSNMNESQTGNSVAITTISTTPTTTHWNLNIVITLIWCVKWRSFGSFLMAILAKLSICEEEEQETTKHFPAFSVLIMEYLRIRSQQYMLWKRLALMWIACIQDYKNNGPVLRSHCFSIQESLIIILPIWTLDLVRDIYLKESSEEVGIPSVRDLRMIGKQVGV